MYRCADDHDDGHDDHRRAIPRRQKIGIAGRNCSWTRSFGTSQISEQNCGQSSTFSRRRQNCALPGRHRPSNLAFGWRETDVSGCYQKSWTNHGRSSTKSQDGAPGSGDAKIAPFPDAIALQNRPLAGAKLTPHAPAPPLSNPSNNTRPPRAILWRMDNRSVAVRRPPCVFLGFEIGGAGVALTHFFPTLAFFRAKNTREKK